MVWSRYSQAHRKVGVQDDEERHPGGGALRRVHRLWQEGSPSLRPSLRADLARVSISPSTIRRLTFSSPHLCLPGSNVRVATKQVEALGRRTGSQRSACRRLASATTSRRGWTTSWGRRRRMPATFTSGSSSPATSRWRSSPAWSTGQKNFIFKLCVCINFGFYLFSNTVPCLFVCLFSSNGFYATCYLASEEKQSKFCSSLSPQQQTLCSCLFVCKWVAGAKLTCKTTRRSGWATWQVSEQQQKLTQLFSSVAPSYLVCLFVCLAYTLPYQALKPSEPLHKFLDYPFASQENLFIAPVFWHISTYLILHR